MWCNSLWRLPRVCRRGGRPRTLSRRAGIYSTELQTHQLQQNCAAKSWRPLSSGKRPLTTYPVLRIGLATAVGGLLLYDGLQHGFTYTGATVRFLRSVRTASLVAYDYLVVMKEEGSEDYDAKLKAVHEKSAKRLLDTCLRNGGLYIKVGQGFAAINHILPKEYTDTLALLQDECLPTSKRDVQKVFLEDFGRLPEDIYDEFEYKPVAAASLAQVFKAKLKQCDEVVAVKVQYSDLEKRFPSDLGTIMFLHDIIELIFKDYNFGWILRDVRQNLESEMDFVHEAQNSEKCAKDLAKFQYVYVPRVHWELTKRRVLTMEWVEGYKISDVERIKQDQLDLRDIDKKLFEAFSEQIFNTGFVHADPHPGNVFVRKNPKSGKAQLVLFDHGLYECLPEHVRLTLCEFWEATVLRDECTMATAALKIDIHDYIKFAEVLFQQPIRLHGNRVRTKLTQADIDYMQEVAKKNFDLIMSTLKEMPRNMLFVVRNLNTIRAIGHQHGDVVDRPKVMARCAQRALYKGVNSFSGYLRWMYKRVVFEYCLWSQSFKFFCLNLYFNLLYKVGRAPEGARTLMRDLTTQDLN